MPTMQTPVDYIEELNILKNAVEKAKTERTKAETNKEAFEKRQAELQAECKELNVEPNNLSAEIKKLDMAISDGLEQARKLIPEEFIRR